MKILLVEDDLQAIEHIERLISDHFSNYLIVGRAQTLKKRQRSAIRQDQICSLWKFN